jgi:DNA polymerase-3 subunit gamma/tau
MLGTVDRGQVLEIVAAILEDDPATVLSLVAHIAEHAPDFVSTLDELASILHQMTIAQTVPDALDTSWPDQARIVELAAHATIDDTQLFWQMATSGRRDVYLASSARAGLEMVLLRMIAFRPAVVIQPQAAAGEPPVKKPEPPATPVVREDDQAVTAVLSGHQDPPALQRSEPMGNTKAAPVAAEAPIVDSADAPVLDEARVTLTSLSPDRWPLVFDALTFAGILHNIALNLELLEVSDLTLRFAIAQADASLFNDRHPEQLSQALSQQIGQTIHATIEKVPQTSRTPAGHRAAVAAQQLAEAEQAISNDDALQQLIRAFDGEIIPGSIRPNTADAGFDGQAAAPEDLA